MLAVLGASLLLGAWRGLVYELMSMLGWIAAFVLAQWWAPEVALRLPMSGATEPVRYAAAFVLVFVAGAVIATQFGWLPLLPLFGFHAAAVEQYAALGLATIGLKLIMERALPWLVWSVEVDEVGE